MPDVHMTRFAASAASPDTILPFDHGLYLGRKDADTFWCGSPEDSVGVVGPTRRGKTSGVLIPSAMLWDGPMISASIKSDVLRATRSRRLEVASLRGGDVHVHAPTDHRTAIDGVKKIHWSPADGCEDSRTCDLRVQQLLGARPERGHGGLPARPGLEVA